MQFRQNVLILILISSGQINYQIVNLNKINYYLSDTMYKIEIKIEMKVLRLHTPNVKCNFISLKQKTALLYKVLFFEKYVWQIFM